MFSSDERPLHHLGHRQVHPQPHSNGRPSFSPSAPPLPPSPPAPLTLCGRFDEDIIMESPSKASARVFALSDGLWRELRERHDDEGFGEVPLAALLADDACLACLKEDELALLRSRLAATQGPVSSVVVDYAELSALLGRKRSDSFRRAMEAGELAGRTRGRRSQSTTNTRRSDGGRRFPALHRLFVTAKNRLGSFRHPLPTHPPWLEDDSRGGERNEHDIAQQTAPSDGQAWSCKLPWLTLTIILVEVALFGLSSRFSLTWPWTLPCHDAEPWRYITASILYADLPSFVLLVTSLALAVTPMEASSSAGRAAFLLAAGILSGALAAVAIDCSSKVTSADTLHGFVTAGNAGTVATAAAVLAHRLSHVDSAKCLLLPSTLALLVYLSLEVAVLVHNAAVASKMPPPDFCPCHAFGGLTAGLWFSHSLLNEKWPSSLRNNRRFLTTFLLYLAAWVFALSLLHFLQEPKTTCEFFSRIEATYRVYRQD